MTARVYSRSREPSEQAMEAQRLLNRYPNLSEQELARLINIFPDLPILDLGLMTADDSLGEKLSAFHRDHARKLPVPIASLVAFLTIPTLFLLALLWWLILV